MRYEHTKISGAGGDGKVRAKKHLGQHFLTDLAVARRIAGSLPAEAGEEVLEVGPGMGVLTQFLIERSAAEGFALAAAEIDAESVAYLAANYPSLKVTEGDFLQMDLAADYPAGVKIIGNFPYNISSQIFFKILDNRSLVSCAVGMVQREVAQRIAEPPGSKTYGILSVLLQAWYDIEYLFTVGEGVFDPPPKVKSAVIRLTRNNVESLGCDETLFRKVVKAGFGQRRKTLRNSLRAGFPALPPEAQHPYYGLRPETLSVAQFVELTNWIAAHTQ